jgi:PPOX class probable F420-dependent enzyme
MGIGDEKYISLTTYTKDGRPKRTPVWVVALDGGEVGVFTQERSWKVKRIRNTPKVVLQPCNARGQVREGTEPIDGAARVVTGDEYEVVRQKVAAKYGFQHSMIGFRDRLAKLFGRDSHEHLGIVVQPDS